MSDSIYDYIRNELATHLTGLLILFDAGGLSSDDVNELMGMFTEVYKVIAEQMESDRAGGPFRKDEPISLMSVVELKNAKLDELERKLKEMFHD